MIINIKLQIIFCFTHKILTPADKFLPQQYIFEKSEIFIK
jgi:hypothetical protein